MDKMTEKYNKFKDAITEKDPFIVTLPLSLTTPKFKPWSMKDGQAVEIQYAEANYRIWKPTFTRSYVREQFELLCKVDYIIGGGSDSHASLYMSFDPDTGLAISVNVSIVDTNGTFSMGEIVPDLSEADSPKVAAAKTSMKVIAGIYDQMQKSDKTGGNLMFPHFIDFYVIRFMEDQTYKALGSE